MDYVSCGIRAVREFNQQPATIALTVPIISPENISASSIRNLRSVNICTESVRDACTQTEPSSGVKLEAETSRQASSNTTANVIDLQSSRMEALPPPYEILDRISIENHCDVYSARNRYDPSVLYELRVYQMHSLPKQAYRYRARHLKRVVSRRSFVDSFDHDGRKIIINNFTSHGHEIEASASTSSDVD
jgi:hypothetical protein